ncbi:MAG: divergent polysaccharide deacetylase family protein [Candidatus Eremiobacteraeota bacterium]|nr:divergent polysaccharide deacetylase family protein [Candidatus Eremiobacteraeota bacterium]
MYQIKRRDSIAGRSHVAAYILVFFIAIAAFIVGIYMAVDEEKAKGVDISRNLKGKTQGAKMVPSKKGQKYPQKSSLPVNSRKNKVEKRDSGHNDPSREGKGRTGEPPLKTESKKEETKDSASEKKASIPEIKRSGSGKVAIIIDDFGNNMNNVDEFCSLDIPVTFAVLPYLKYSKETSRKALSSGKAVILHLPLENKAGINPGYGTLDTGMKRDALVKEFRMNLSFVPGADGFNNHEGSKATEDEEMMREILEQAKRKNLFFIDSMTSSKSVGLRVARELGVSCARRNVFLDNNDNVDYICGQLTELAEKAMENGSAIGIGHVRKNTYEAIEKMTGEMRKKGIEFVFVRELVN